MKNFVFLKKNELSIEKIKKLNKNIEMIFLQ